MKKACNNERDSQDPEGPRHSRYAVKARLFCQIRPTLLHRFSSAHPLVQMLQAGFCDHKVVPVARQVQGHKVKFYLVHVIHGYWYDLPIAQSCPSLGSWPTASKQVNPAICLVLMIDLHQQTLILGIASCSNTPKHVVSCKTIADHSMSY